MKPSFRFFWLVGAVFVVVVHLPVFFMAVTPFLGSTAMDAQPFSSLFGTRQVALVVNSLVVSGGAALLSMLAGGTAALLCGRTNLAGRRLFEFMALVPLLIPPYIQAIVWSRLEAWMQPVMEVDLHGIAGATAVMALSGFPFMFLTTRAGLAAIDPHLEEASLMMRGAWTTLWRITLPLVRHHVAAGGILVFMLSVVNVSMPDILRVKAYPIEIFIQYSAFYDSRGAALLSLPLVALAMVLVVLQNVCMHRRSYVQASGFTDTRAFFSLGRWQGTAVAFMGLLAGVSVVVPVTCLLWSAGSFSGIWRAVQGNLSVIVYSISLAAAGGFSALVLGFFVAYAVRHAGAGMATVWFGAALFPLAVPGTTIGIGMIGVWNHPCLDLAAGKDLLVVMGYVARYLPISVIILTSGFGQIQASLEEAAFLSGKSVISRLGCLFFPLSGLHCRVAYFSVFALSLGELETTLMVIPPGRETLPVKIYNLMHYGADETVSALCLAIVIGVTAGAGLLFWKPGRNHDPLRRRLSPAVRAGRGGRS